MKTIGGTTEAMPRALPTEMPLRGEDTDAVLTDLAHLTPEDLASLRADGVIGG